MSKPTILTRAPEKAAHFVRLAITESLRVRLDRVRERATERGMRFPLEELLLGELVRTVERAERELGVESRQQSE